MKKYQMEQKEEFLDISTYQMLYLKAKIFPSPGTTSPSLENCFSTIDGDYCQSLLL